MFGKMGTKYKKYQNLISGRKLKGKNEYIFQIYIQFSKEIKK